MKFLFSEKIFPFASKEMAVFIRNDLLKNKNFVFLDIDMYSYILMYIYQHVNGFKMMKLNCLNCKLL